MINSDAGFQIANDEELTKHYIRTKVWDYLTENGIGLFPQPLHNRIPTFKGCSFCGQTVAKLPEFTDSNTVKVNPDKPQEEVRFLTLQANKKLLVPSPRLRHGLFNLLENCNDNATTLRKKAKSEGVQFLSVPLDLKDKITVDLIVIGSVAVSVTGRRIGKGEGFADLEYAMMKTMDAVNDDVPIVTTVHDCQVFDDLPERLFQEYDVPVDIIVTPTKVLTVSERLRRPKGIYWNLLSVKKFLAIPILRKLYDIDKKNNIDVTLLDGSLPPDEEYNESVESSGMTKNESRGKPYSYKRERGNGEREFSEFRVMLEFTRGGRGVARRSRGRKQGNEAALYYGREGIDQHRGGYRGNFRGRGNPRGNFRGTGRPHFDEGADGENGNHHHFNAPRGRENNSYRSGGPYSPDGYVEMNDWKGNYQGRERGYQRSPGQRFRGRGNRRGGRNHRESERSYTEDRTENNSGGSNPTEEESSVTATTGSQRGQEINDGAEKDPKNIQVTINISKQNKIVRRRVEETDEFDREGTADPIDEKDYSNEPRPYKNERGKGNSFSIYVGGMPYNCRFNDLKKEVYSRNVKPSFIAWKNYGFAFLDFHNYEEDAETVLESLKGLSLNERPLKINIKEKSSEGFVTEKDSAAGNSISEDDNQSNENIKGRNFQNRKTKKMNLKKSEKKVKSPFKANLDALYKEALEGGELENSPHMDLDALHREALEGGELENSPHMNLDLDALHKEALEEGEFENSPHMDLDALHKEALEGGEFENSPHMDLDALYIEALEGGELENLPTEDEVDGWGDLPNDETELWG